MKTEKISCIVTVYNRFDYVRNIINCLIRQSLQPYELLLADDGSKEDIFDYIKDLLPKCKFKIKHIYQEDLAFRLARSRNNAARASEGDFLIFFDQDIIFDNDFLEKIYNNRKENFIIMTRAIYSDEDEKNKIIKLIAKNSKYEDIYYLLSEKSRINIIKKQKKDFFYNILYKLKLRSRGAKIIGLFFALYKKDFIKINGFDEKFIGWGSEDDDFCNRFYKAGGKVKSLAFKFFPVHLYHNFASSKENNPNEKYYREQKKKINSKNYKAVYGFDNTLGEDKFITKILK